MVATVGVLPLEYPLTGTVCTNITGLQENNSYTISIKLTNSAGIGPASTVISVLTPEASEYSPLLIFLYWIIEMTSQLSDVFHPC